MTALALETLNRAQMTDTENFEISAAQEAIDDLFTYHPWTDAQIDKGAKVKEELKKAYLAILVHVPACPSRTRALNCLTDARMLANAAISFNGRV